MSLNRLHPIRPARGFSPAVAATLRVADAELTARARLVEDVRREGFFVAAAVEPLNPVPQETP